MSASLIKLFDGLVSLPEAFETSVMGLTLDSRRVSNGDLFFASAGSRTHGSLFIHDAIARGAVAVVVEKNTDTADYSLRDGVKNTDTADYSLRDGVPIIELPNLRYHLGRLAARFYGYPSRHFTTVVGVTGTNGKTSIANFLGQILHCDAAPCAVLGTLGVGFHGQLVPSTYTTPDAIALQGILANLTHRGAHQLIMEVSSHALDQGRVEGVNFDIAIFTNLTRDHLDYHGDMEAYGRAKQRLFQTAGLKYAVINLDDEFGRALSRKLSKEIQVVGYGFSSDGDENHELRVQATQLSLSSTGLRMTVMTPWGTGILESSLLGRFNAVNLLAVLSTLGVRGIPLDDALCALSRVSTVSGRMETLGGGSAPLVVVDYAHTPDALEQALLALREHTSGRLYCVFGCGGERDCGKRPLMGAVAERLADVVVITNDNPRSEGAVDILRAILNGMMTFNHATIILDRAKAIHYAISSANSGDVVLVAGKGHEDYQQIGSTRFPFSDRSEVIRTLKELPNHSSQPGKFTC